MDRSRYEPKAFGSGWLIGRMVVMNEIWVSMVWYGMLVGRLQLVKARQA